MPKKIKDGDGNLIPERRNNNGYRYIKIAMSLLVIAIGWLFIINSRADIKIEKMEGAYTEIKVSISEISTDIKWIKREFERRR